MEIHIAQSPYHRGYHPLGEENALGSEVHDLKEVFDMALELPTDDPAVLQGKPFHGPNAWPAAFPEFKPLMLRLYEEWRALCGRISALFAPSFGLPESYFVERSDKPMCQLRAAKYPPQHPPSDLSPIGCGAHTDYGVVSTIWQIDVPDTVACNDLVSCVAGGIGRWHHRQVRRGRLLLQRPPMLGRHRWTVRKPLRSGHAQHRSNAILPQIANLSTVVGRISQAASRFAAACGAPCTRQTN